MGGLCVNKGVALIKMSARGDVHACRALMRVCHLEQLDR